MLFVVESVILCILFTVMIVPTTYKNPVSQLYNYPPEVIKRVKSMPEYEGKIPKNQNKLVIKLGACVLFIVLLSLVAYFSGQHTFWKAFLYNFALWNVVNWYDALVLDICIFGHVKRFRLPGTEDMVGVYTNPWFYIKGAFTGMAIGLVICALSAGAVALIVIVI